MEEAENPDNGPIPKTDDSPNSPAKSCALCGCSTPAVRCDRCSSQIFCLSCDDMYHRHPKRRLHLRKAVDSIWNSSKSPRLRSRTELPGDPSKIPIPPPRSKKRERHTVGGRLFLKQSHELGSFGHSKMFDLRTIAPPPKNVFAGQKTSPNVEQTYENEANLASNVVQNIPGNDIYENENIPINTGENIDNSNSMGRAPWNPPRTNISSPIQVSIPSSSPDMMTNGQSFGYPPKPQSRSITDLTGPPHPIGTHPYPLPHYPYMHPPMHPPYSHSMAHLNCPQCMSSSWSNLMSPHPSPYFHPMPWGSANASLARAGNGKHGSVPSFADPNFHFPYPGGAFYTNGAPAVDPNFLKDLPQPAVETQKVRKSPSGSRQTLSPENPETMDVAENPSPEVNAEEVAAEREINRRKQEIDVDPPKIPEPPKRPWSCLHCTYVNPPGIHICEICCKTSYGNTSPAMESHTEGRSLDSRNSESPMELVNLDALSQSPDFIKQRVQKDEDSIGADSLETEEIPEIKDQSSLNATPEPSVMLTTETQTSTTTKTTDVQTQNIVFQSIASSTDSIFPKQEISVQTDTEVATKNCSVATDPMISSQSMESLMSGVSAPPYHNRRAGWGRGVSFSTQSLYERGRSRSPIPRSLSEAQSFVRDSSLPPEEAMHSWSQAWLMSDPMYYKPHNLPGYGQAKEDYFDGTWGSMDKLNRRVKSKQGKKTEVNPRPKFHRSLDDLKAEKTQDVIHSRELQFLQTVKEAERCGFSLEDLHVAYLHCGRENPVFWLEDNWSFMIKNVIALAAKYGEDNEENDVGVVTASEAKQALHIHRGDIWDAVTECIENRQRKILELTVRGNFTQKQIADALKNNEGNVELAYADLLRASTRRHKFILSPGLSEDSEYNPVDESTLDHSVQTKGGKLDVPTDTKTDKKKSDFLTKLSAIRQAQSERRKAREEKEMIRESTTQEVSDTLDPRMESPLSESIIPEKPDEPSHQEPVAEEPVRDIEKELEEAKLEFDEPPSMIIQEKSDKKKDTDDNILEDYDTNWVESQGEWIEEYSDEQWDEEGDGQWVSLQKKYQSMEKEFEEEARQMAALWEKEELEDDVFEEEPKEALLESEAEKIKQEQDAKFQQWVKVNLEKSLSEPEEIELNDQPLTLSLSKEPSLSRSVEFDEGLLCKSPLQHYPTEFDLSLKTEPDWVELETGTDATEKEEVEFTKEVKEDVENHSQMDAADISDEDWEKIDLEIEMLDEKAVEKLTRVPIVDSYEKPLSPVSVGEKDFRSYEGNYTERDFSQDTTKEQINNLTSLVTESSKETELKTVSAKEKSSEVAMPKPPVRRRSKLNTAAIEEVLKSHEPVDENTQLSSDKPPALPLKKKDKSPENITKDIYAVPDKHKAKIEGKSQTNDEPKTLSETQAPLKPPRVNLSPSTDIEGETGEKKSLNSGFSKDASPVTSLSNESDSNCFADSESDPEIKIIRQKYMHRKAAKYENEEDDIFDETDLINKREELESPSALRKEVELQSSAAKGFDFNPELPIPVGTRGSRVVEIDEVESPKAFREGTARPLQLFKVTKQSSTEMAPELVQSEQHKDIDTMVSGIVRAYHEHVSEIPAPLNVSQQTNVVVPSDSNIRDTQSIYISEPQSTHFDAVDPHYYNTRGFEQSQSSKTTQETLNVQQVTSEIPLEIFDNSIPIEPIPEEPSSIPYVDELANNEEEINFTEVEGVSAAADYFFGRYNEVIVAKPKKRAPAQKSKTQAAAASKAMSTSDIKVAPVSQPTLMEKSASPVMMPSPSSVQESVNNTQLEKASQSPKLEEKMVQPVEPAKEPEYLPFADDYFFGSYNEVVVPKKGKKKIPPKPIQKVPEKAKTDEVLTSTSFVPQTVSELASSGTSQTITSTPMAVTSALQHAESTTSLYFDTSSLMEDTFYLAETPEEPVENMVGGGNGKKSDIKGKSVHFVDPQIPVVPPPRRNRQKPPESNRSSASSYTSVPDEFMFEQYGSSSQLSMVDKKKLHSCSEDFKLNHGCDPPEFSSESVFQPNNHQKSVISSEISVYTFEEPLNLTETSNTGLSKDLSVELQSSELSCSDKVQDFLDRHSPLSQDSVNTFKTNTFNNSGDKNFDLESSEIQHFGKLQASCLHTEDISTVSGKFLEDALATAENILAEQSSSVEFSKDKYSSEPTLSSHSHNISKETINTNSEILETGLETSVETLITPQCQKESKVNLEMLEDDESICKATSNKTEFQISDKNLPDSQADLISDSYTVKVESGTSMVDIIQDDRDKSEIEQDTYSVHIDEEFEDGLRLVEETENLINELCDIYPPGIFDIASSNEIQNLNNKNNKQESTYDSEHEWKLNEERYNTLNASFIESKLYKPKSDLNQSFADDKDSLIIDTKTSELNISTEVTTPDFSGISELAFESIENQMDTEQSEIYSVENLIPENEKGPEKSLVIQMPLQSVPANVVQSLSILCQTATSSLDIEASCDQSVSIDDVPTTEDEENLLTDSDYSKCELLDVSIDISDKSSVNSTRSSISTQIPLHSDVQIQDLNDELDYQTESKTPVQTAFEECDTILNTIDQTSISDDLSIIDKDPNTDFPLAEKYSTPVSSTPVLDIDSLTIDNEETILLKDHVAESDEGLPSTDLNTNYPTLDHDANISLKTSRNDKIILSVDHNINDSFTVDHITSVSLPETVTKITPLSTDKDANISFSEESYGSIPMSIDYINDQYGIINECSSSMLSNESLVNKEHVLQIQNNIMVVEQCHDTRVSDSELIIPDSIEPADKESTSKDFEVIASCPDESLEVQSELPLEENNEDSCESLMSHFYDEWIESVKTSAKSSITQLNVATKYAAYYNYAESSSNSGSASENEDFSQIKEIEVSSPLKTQNEVFDYQTNASVIDQSRDIQLWEDDQDLNIDVKDLPIASQTCSNLNIQLTPTVASEVQQKEMVYEVDIKNSEEYSDGISEDFSKLDTFKNNRENAGCVEMEEKIFTFTKSCQTDDSFEEDVFFDSFDDPLMDPSFLFSPVDKKEKNEPVKVEIGIQCHLISNEVTVPSVNYLDSVSSVKSHESETVEDYEKCVEESIFEDPMDLNDAEIKKVLLSDITIKPNEDGSFEISEDSDSDLFLEPNSTHVELDAEGKHSKSSFLYAEIDSGFSSGSDYGAKTFQVAHEDEHEEMIDQTLKVETESTSKILSANQEVTREASRTAKVIKEGIGADQEVTELNIKEGEIVQEEILKVHKRGQKSAHEISETHKEKSVHKEYEISKENTKSVDEESKMCKEGTKSVHELSKINTEETTHDAAKVNQEGAVTSLKVIKVNERGVESTAETTEKDKDLTSTINQKMPKPDKGRTEAVNELVVVSNEKTIADHEISKANNGDAENQCELTEISRGMEIPQEITVQSATAITKADFVNSSLGENSKSCDEILEISSVVMTHNIVAKDSCSDSKILACKESSTIYEEDIFERAVTPIAIVKVPSIEDLTFIEIETDITEQVDNPETIPHSESCSTPTVEYFYGSLPTSVLSEIPIESNDCFVEALDLLDPDISEERKNQLNILASLVHDESISTSELNIESDELSESLSSFHELDDDSLAESVSEYFVASDDEDKTSSNELFQDKNLSSMATPSTSLFKTSQVTLTQSPDQKSNLKPVPLTKSMAITEVKGTATSPFILGDVSKTSSKKIIETLSVTTESFSECVEHKELEGSASSPSITVCNIRKKSLEEQIDLKWDETTESFSIEQDSLDVKDKTCDASELEDSLYLDSASEYSLPADTLSKHLERITKPLPETSDLTNVIPQVAVTDILPNSDDNFQNTIKLEVSNLNESVIKNEEISEVPFALNQMKSEENAQYSSLEEQIESIYSESQSEYFTPEKVNAEIPSSEIAFDATPFVVENMSADLENNSSKKMSITQLKSSENAISNSSETNPDLLQTLGASNKNKELSLLSSAIDEILYLESIPDYFASESISIKPEKVEKSLEIQTISKEPQNPFLTKNTDLSTNNEEISIDSKQDSSSCQITKVLSTSDDIIKPLDEDMKVTFNKSDIPLVPSDIVRYLYYGDDITFEEDPSMCDDPSFNSASNIELVPDSSVHSEKSLLSLDSESKGPKKDTERVIKNDMPSDHFVSKDASLEITCQDSLSSRDEESLEYKSIQSFPTDPEYFESAYSEHESTEQWYDLDTTKSLNVFEAVVENIPKSDSCTETNSLTKEDGDSPCIPELILEKGAKDDFPVAKVDSDEVTDISTHFTMTEDDSDKFSDIESDSSLQDFEVECGFSVDIHADRIAIDDEVEKDDYEIVCREDHLDSPENITKALSEGENLRQNDMLLDQNDKELDQICSGNDNLEREQPVDDIQIHVPDVNGNVIESPVCSPTLEAVETLPLETNSSLVELEISTTESKYFETLDLNISSNSSLQETAGDEFCDVSQTTESCYISQVIESDNWLDANNESMVETEDSVFVLPYENAPEAISLSAPDTSIPSQNILISEFKEIIPSLQIENNGINEDVSTFPLVTDMNKMENVVETVLEIPYASEVIVPHNLSVTNAFEQTAIKEDLIIQKNTNIVQSTDSIKDNDSVTPIEREAIIKTEFASVNEVLISDALGQDVIPEEASREFYETKEEKFEDLPKGVEVLPSVVSDVIETECMLNFGNKEEISVPLEGKVCYEVPEDPAIQSKSDSTLERASASTDLNSSEVAVNQVDKNVVDGILQEVEEVNIVQPEETFSFSKFGYLFKEGKLFDTCDNFPENKTESILNLDIGLPEKHTEEQASPKSCSISDEDKFKNSFLEINSDFVEESEQNIVTMGQISSVLYPKTEDKHYIEDKESSYMFIDSDDLDTLKKDDVSSIHSQDILITSECLNSEISQIQETSESLDGNISPSITLKTFSDEISQVVQQSLVKDEPSYAFNQHAQEDKPLKIKESVSKDEQTDTSFHTLSEESDSWHEEDNEALVEDFPLDDFPTIEGNDNPEKEIMPMELKVYGKEDIKIVCSDQQQNTENIVESENIVCNHENLYSVSATSLKSLDDDVQKEVSDKIDTKTEINQFTMPSDIDDKKSIDFFLQKSSKIEPLSCSETDSIKFYSACDEIDNASIITSDEDFTDVPSHFTLADGSEAWSDVETDISTAFDDCEDHSFSSLERDKTPTRDFGGYTFREDNLYSIKGDLAVLTKDDQTEHKELETKANIEKCQLTSLVSEDEAKVEEYLSLKQTSSSQPCYDDSLSKAESSSHSVIASADNLSSKVLIQETDICVRDTSNEILEASSSTQALEEVMQFDTSETDVHKNTRVSLEIQDINQISVAVAQSMLPNMPKEENSEKLSELGMEESEQSSCSEFKTISKEEVSESFSDIESEIYEELEENLSQVHSDTFDFIPFADESGKSTVKRNKNCKKSGDQEGSDGANSFRKKSIEFEVKKDLKVESNDIETEICHEKIAGQVSLGDGKRTLSLSIADIVEASELHLKTDETTETLLLEQFADIESLDEPVVIADIFETFQPDTAIPKIHEDAGDVSLHLEMTEESDYWLEAETEYSISEFEDEAVSLSAKEISDPFVVDVIDAHEEQVYATSSQHSDETAAGISTTFYTDTDYSEQLSDTCADISLQGGTTDTSDKWSDIEGDAAIDEALYGLTKTSEANKEDVTTAPSFSLYPGQQTSKLSEFRESHDDSCNLPLTGTTEKINKQSNLKVEIGKIGISETTSLQFTLDASEKVTDSISESYTQPLSDLSVGNISASGVSDEDFTSITPLDVTVDELDKWSDISDASLEEIQYDRKSTPPRVISDVEKISEEHKVNEFESNIEKLSETVLVLSNDHRIASNTDSKHEVKNVIETIEDASIEKIQPLKEESPLKHVVESSTPFLKEDATIDESIVYEELTLDTIQEISEADNSVHLDLDKDKSNGFAKTESEVINETGTYDRNDLSVSPAYENEDYDNYDGNFEEYVEGEEYDRNIEENEMEFGDEDFPERSIPYIENEDELVYPLQSEDWMGESFDLKEYGVDYGLSGSEADIHGYGINDEYEDMQRAIDFNISNFDERIDDLVDDQNLTTESFKTISNGTPSHSKMTEKEHESWSTADADSIEDDLSEHDNVLSKIDELLAEDFAYHHTDYYRDEESLDVLGNENTQCFSSLDSFKIVDEEAVLKTDSCALHEKENVAEVEKDKSSSELLSKESKSVVIKNAASGYESTDITIEQSENIAPKVLPDIPETVSESHSYTSSKPSEPFITRTIDESDTVSTVNSSSNISSEQSDSLTEKESGHVVPKMLSNVESSAGMLCDKSDSLAQKMLKTSSATTTVNDFTEKISSEQEEHFELKKISEAVSGSVQVEDSNCKTISEQSQFFGAEKQSGTVMIPVSVEDIYSKTILEQMESSRTKKSSGIFTESAQVKDVNLEKTILDQSDSSVIKKTHETETGFPKVEDSNALSESFIIKKPPETVTGSVLLEDTNSKQVSQQSDSFAVKKSSGTVTGSVQVEESNSKTPSEKSESFVAKKPSGKLTESGQIEDSTFETISEQSDSFVVKKLFGTVTESVKVKDSTLKTTSEQSESFAVKKLSGTVTASVKVEDTNRKPTSEQSESFTIKESSKILSETIPVVEPKCKTFELSDSLTVEKISTIVSASDSNVKILSGDESGNEILSSEPESFSKKSLSKSNAGKLSPERPSKTNDISSKAMDVSQNKDETSVALYKTKQTLTTEVESMRFAGKTNDELSASTVEVPTTLTVQPIVNDEISKTESNIPFENKPLTEKASEEHHIKSEVTTDFTESTETAVRRRVRKSSSQSATASFEEESGDTKPDIPLKRRRDSRKASLSSPGDLNTTSSSDTSEESKTKPDIPEKRRRRPKPEAEPSSGKSDAELPSLPPKTIRRDSSTDSISSSVFSSASSESLSCYESASLKDSSELETAAKIGAVVEASPEVPARKSSVRQRRRESCEDTSSSSISRSSSSRRSYDLPPKESMDLCRKRTSIDERMVKLQAAGKCTTKETAFIAAKLLEMQFDEEDALLASRQCSSIYHAVKFLTQLCELCQCRFPINSMASMIHCAHRACKECLKAHFTTQIYDRTIFTLLCPICQKPDITDQNIQEYFNHLEIMFRDILDSNVYDLFQRKLRDEVLTKDPNFHWCSQCSSGFIASPRLKKLYCPDCSAITCASCHQTWESEHEGVHCERFQQWKDMHTPEPPPAGLVKYLTDRGITCPSCEINYAQACGGCMLYKCSHCSYEFCGFCSKPCKRGKDCGNKQCESRGIHIHHPFNCLFFIRDKDISELQMLLDEESVKYLTIPPEDQIVKSRCQVREQKHTHGSITEDRCGRDIVPYCAGLCRTHYYEYLAELLKKNKINPLPLMTIQDLQFMLRKSRCPVPEKVKGESNEDFYERLTEAVSSTLT